MVRSSKWWDSLGFSRLTAEVALIFTLGCGGSSKNETGSTGAGGAGGSGGLAGAGGATAGQAGISGTGGASAGMAGTAGTSDDPLLGLDCGDSRCTLGQACVRCQTDPGQAAEPICVPHPVSDPTGYAQATAVCENSTTIYDDCDGPEDCADDEYCVAQEGVEGFLRCRAMPSQARSCCFACGAATDCTICRTTEDCPDGEECLPAQVSEFMGCR